MSEFETHANWLAACGIAVPAYRIVTSATEASSAAKGLRYPLVAKPVPESAEHKTEQGLVHLRLGDEQALTAAVLDIQSKLPGAPMLIQEMIGDVVEVLLAMREDADFGPVAAIGLGGTMVELLEEISFLSLPASAEEFRRAINASRMSKLLAGFRGQTPRDVDALVQAASRLGDAFLDARARLSEFEINPLGVRAVGKGVVALDILGVPRPGTSSHEACR